MQCAVDSLSCYPTYLSPLSCRRRPLCPHPAGCSPLVARSISSVIPLDDRLPFRTLRRRQLKKALASSLTIAEDEDFASFWPILEENLHERYGVSPVHSLEEITRLHNNFPARSPFSVYAMKPKRWVDALCMRLTR